MTVHLYTETSGRGRPVVLTHGLGDTADTWDELVPSIATSNRVTRWDLRGHGRSDAPADPGQYSRDLAVADLLQVIAQADEPVTLIGHSLGGYLSLVVALQHPNLVRALVMIASGPGFRDPTARSTWNDYVDRAALRMPIGEHASRLCHQPDALVIEALPSLRCPLLQVVGGDDTRFHDGVAYVHRVLPASTVLTIPGAGHHPQTAHAQQVADALAPLLS